MNGKQVVDNSKKSAFLLSCGVTPPPTEFEVRLNKIFAALEKDEPLPELCVELHKQPLPENNVPYMEKKVPLGDTVFMRYHGIFSGIINKSVARTFTAVTLSTDMDFKLKTLKQLAHAEQKNLVRYRAWLELARLHLRNRNQKMASSALSKALGITLDNEAWKADAHFLQASVHFTNKDINAALPKLETALRSDPNFVDAYVLYIRALLEASLQKETYFSQDNCTNKLTKLMDSLDMIACVTNDRHTFVHLAKSIESLPAEQKIKSFIVGYGNLLAGNYLTAEQRMRSLLKAKTQWNSSPCTNLLIKQASQVLQKISTLKP
ncbi:MAG: hypothetical protein DRR19_14815 [Candidatus Parabeggiatoa sp. nov. 1]|nr:MAG: hypothetical protein DRR19_14815 [Gammaproteobacteria bacterium]